MEIDRPKQAEEPLGTRQELLNRVFTTFLSFPPTEVEYVLIDPEESDTEDNRRLTAHKSAFRFKQGTTDPKHSDHLAGVYSLETEELELFYGKGMFEEKITLKRNPESNNVDLVRYMVYTKDAQTKSGGSFSMIPALHFISGEPLEPHLHAVESLLKQISTEVENNPKHFQVQATMKMREQAQRDPHELKERKKLAKRLGAVLKVELASKREEGKKKNGNGKSNSRRRSV